MDNTMMIGLARQMTLRRSMDIAANNIANMATAGFKAEHELLAERPMGHARDVDGGEPIKYVTDWGVLRDFRTGALEHTGRPFDLALQGEGFFTVQTEGGGEQYTRDGRFTVSPDGQLVAQDGAPVLGEGGAPITIDPALGDVAVGPNGAVTAGGVEVGRLQIVTFDNLAALQKAGGGRLTAPDNAAPVAAEAPDVRQGFYEASNVNSVQELTRMLEITRTYQSVSKMIEESADLSRRSIERLGSAPQ